MRYSAEMYQGFDGRRHYIATYVTPSGTTATLRHCNGLAVTFPTHAIALDRAAEAFENANARWRT